MSLSARKPDREPVVSREAWLDYLDRQAETCRRDGSPLYGALLDHLRLDYAEGGVTAELLAGWRGHPVLDAAAMRMLGAVHRLVLAGQAGELARFFPSAGGDADPKDAAAPLLRLLRDRADFVRERLTEHVQTNEVRRSAALLPGFLEIARRTGLPLRVHEIGASAGLNHLWDRYRYRLGPHAWGDPAATLAIECDWRGEAPALEAPLRVVGRAACDLHPIDLREPDAQARLESFVWPDQPERLMRLRAAAAIVREAALPIDRSPALPWIERHLAAPERGVANVLFHSIMWLYLSEEERRGILAWMRRLGDQATPDAPVAWLQMEAFDYEKAALRLRTWPSPEGKDDFELLGFCGHHGQWVEWQRGARDGPG